MGESLKEKQHRRGQKLILSGIITATILIGIVWFYLRSGTSEKEGTNVILFSIDTTRMDHCSVYGYDRDTTPNLRAFAAKGARFDSAYAPTATTGPTHATIFTSLYPRAHGVIKNGLSLSHEFETLAERLSTSGYQTAAIVSSFVLDAKFGYAQGFSFYDDDFSFETSSYRSNRWEGHRVEHGFDRPADDTTSRAINWLKNMRNQYQAFFLFVHYFDPHDPYTPPEPFLSQLAPSKQTSSWLEKVISQYDGEIAFVDHEIGRLLNALKQMGIEENTLIVITSDHGEGLMQHGHMLHGVHIYEEAVRIPLLFRWPQHIPGNKVFKSPVGLVGLTPTILDLIGIKPESRRYQGVSFAPMIRGETISDTDRQIFLYRRHYDAKTVGKIQVKGEKFGIIDGNWKYIEGAEEKSKELFNLDSDPRELRNLYDTSPRKALTLASQLEVMKRRYSGADSKKRVISKDDLSTLKSLGYVE
jgi:choline-sulfatase